MWGGVVSGPGAVVWVPLVYTISHFLFVSGILKTLRISTLSPVEHFSEILLRNSLPMSVLILTNILTWLDNVSTLMVLFSCMTLCLYKPYEELKMSLEVGVISAHPSLQTSI